MIGMSFVSLWYTSPKRSLSSARIMYWIGPICPGPVGGISFSALAVMSKRFDVAQPGTPSSWNG
jgi:hypothetical protein